MQMNLATVHTNQLNGPIDISFLSHCAHVRAHTHNHWLKQSATGFAMPYTDTHPYQRIHDVLTHALHQPARVKLPLTPVNSEESIRTHVDVCKRH